MSLANLYKILWIGIKKLLRVSYLFAIAAKSDCNWSLSDLHTFVRHDLLYVFYMYFMYSMIFLWKFNEIVSFQKFSKYLIYQKLRFLLFLSDFNCICLYLDLKSWSEFFNDLYNFYWLYWVQNNFLKRFNIWNCINFSKPQKNLKIKQILNFKRKHY